MTATTCNVSLHTERKDVQIDILRGAGLAVSMFIIFALPLGMVLVAGLKP